MLWFLVARAEYVCFSMRLFSTGISVENLICLVLGHTLQTHAHKQRGTFMCAVSQTQMNQNVGFDLNVGTVFLKQMYPTNQYDNEVNKKSILVRRNVS